MNRVTLEYKGQRLYLNTFSNSTDNNLSPTLQCNCHSLFSTCFQGRKNVNCEEVFPFLQENGCGIVVNNDDDEALLLTSFIWNPATRAVEIYNICKNPNNSQFSAYAFLNELLTDFIPDNPLFPNPSTIRLALLCNNKYLVPAFITYCRLGFTVDSPNEPVSSFLTPHVTMSRPVGHATPSDPDLEFQKMVMTCQYSNGILDSIRDTIDQHKPTVDFTEHPVEDERDTLLSKISFMPKE